MIEWNVSPEIFSLGPLTIRWYGLLFALGFIVGFNIMTKIYRKEGKPEDDLNDLLWFMILGTVLGSRLGHCLFYNPSYYLSNPIEILKVWKGGLASHGAAIGILLSVFIYSKKKKNQSFIWLMDRIVITVALAGSFIRMGNLFNSEIIGKATNVAWSFIFQRIDNIPRHPAQLYESIGYMIIFLILFTIYLRNDGKINEGFLFGLFMLLVFSFRFIVEFIKEDQTYFEKGMILNMGQLLSIPLIIFGIYLVFKSNFNRKEEQGKK